METIILKVILCSGIVLGLYYLFLAKEKTFTFNRFYLLLGLVFSYSIPFVTIETPQIEDRKPTIIFEQEIPQQILQTPIEAQTEAFDYIQLLWIGYFVILGILILKILYSIIKIKSLKGRKIIYQNRAVVLLDKEIAPFSFLNIIYLSENYFKDRKIDERIFLHEEIHVKQKHSFDVLLVEVLKAFSWFNPFIYLYKNAMITNHEFLADEEVITKNEDIKNYQELILNEVLKQQNLNLTHQFNFNNTKKRFIMMTKRNSKFAKAKKYLAIPAFAVLAVLFAEKVYANDSSSENLVESNILSDDPYTEFKKILSKYSELIEKKEYAEFEKKISDEEKQKLAELYAKLSNQQQNEQPIIFLNLSDYKKIVPTEKQINDFSNAQKYLAVINGRQVSNTELAKYKSSDFSYYSITESSSKPFSVTLMTNSYFKKYVKEKNPVMAFVSSDITPPISRKSFSQDTITPKRDAEAKVLKQNSTKDKDLSIPPPHPPSANFVQASFPEGMNILRSKVAQNFDGSVFKGDEGTVKSAVYIVIDENGSVDKVVATGDSKIFNDESERAVKSVVAKTKWKPATDNGKPVKTTFSLPLTMTFESAKKTQ
ncbi:MAG: family metallopeptidase [Chryseobacterium sp.]|jgi:hypothetical protein|uniref:M56 family metallopeptidase n=1 Tax=Chryseobacterium sp. TaxID=1871047 RepID=UPI00261D12CB|nr:M56 family metallopeptidase [Chryseobacterium sp.]MDF2551602.1 family metallopeptidase [Chryseobacterium sp.]